MMKIIKGSLMEKSVLQQLAERLESKDAKWNLSNDGSCILGFVRKEGEVTTNIVIKSNGSLRCCRFNRSANIGSNSTIPLPLKLQERLKRLYEKIFKKEVKYPEAAQVLEMIK
jgi:hypothetical protein